MNNFPVKFFAHHVQTDVEQNRMKKIEQELKIIRNKIVDSFQSSVSYHSEVQHDLLPDLTEDEKKSFYCTIKDELSKRGFTVRGKCTDGQLSLIIFSNAPRTVEMDRILKQYVDQSGRRSRSSSVGGQIKQENTPVSAKELARSNTFSTINTERKQSESDIAPETREAKPRSNSLKGRNISSTFKSKIPIIQSSSSSNLKSKQQSTSVPTTPSSSRISASTSAPSTPLSATGRKSTISLKTANSKSEEPVKYEKDIDNLSTHSESDESFNNEITMDFIMNKLKKANERRQNKNKEHV